MGWDRWFMCRPGELVIPMMSAKLRLNGPACSCIRTGWNPTEFYADFSFSLPFVFHDAQHNTAAMRMHD